jgi:endonuclease III
MPPDETKQRLRQVLRRLKKLYPEVRTALNYETPLQLMVAVILSAQCTDARVNLVTPALFERYQTAQDFADSDQHELERFISSTGFFRNKAKSIRGACREIVDRFGGEVPQTLEELLTLPGLGRKSSNVVLGDAFGVPGITVDTHVGRLSRRLGLTDQTDPVKAEFELMELMPKKEWIGFNHRLIYHGRLVCKSLRPRCDECVLFDICPKIGLDETEEATPESE